MSEADVDLRRGVLDVEPEVPPWWTPFQCLLDGADALELGNLDVALRSARWRIASMSRTLLFETRGLFSDPRAAQAAGLVPDYRGDDPDFSLEVSMSAIYAQGGIPQGSFEVVNGQAKTG